MAESVLASACDAVAPTSLGALSVGTLFHLNSFAAIVSSSCVLTYLRHASPSSRVLVRRFLNVGDVDVLFHTVPYCCCGFFFLIFLRGGFYGKSGPPR